MKRKVERLLGQTSEVHVSTFHSFCAEIIREHADRCGIPPEFSILEDVDSSIMMYRELGANAVVCVRFATSEVSTGAAELMVYGTAVVIV